MSDTILTAEQVEDMRLTALLRVDPMAGRVMALSGSHESIRADRDRLREERDKWQTDHGLLSDDYRDLSQDIDRLRQALETVQMHWSTLAARYQGACDAARDAEADAVALREKLITARDMLEATQKIVGKGTGDGD